MNPKDYENIYNRHFVVDLRALNEVARERFMAAMREAAMRKPLVWTRDDRAFLASIKIQAD